MNPMKRNGRFDLSVLPLCGAKTRSGRPCRRYGNIINGRCKLHGGRSTGPVTREGLSASRRANYKHGHRSKAHALTIAQMNFDLYMANALIDNPKRVVTDVQEAWAKEGIKQLKTLDFDNKDSIYDSEPIRTKGML